MEAVVEYGLTGAWVSLGLRTNELSLDVCHPFNSANGCLDAPEFICCGSAKNAINGNGELIVHSSFQNRGA